MNCSSFHTLRLQTVLISIVIGLGNNGLQGTSLNLLATDATANSGSIQNVQLAPVVPLTAITLFELIPESITGIDLRHEFPTNAPFDLLTDQCSGSGVCIGDYDGDGWPDIYITYYNCGNRLYRNLGNWRFADVTQRASVSGEGRGAQAPPLWMSIMMETSIYP